MGFPLLSLDTSNRADHLVAPGNEGEKPLDPGLIEYLEDHTGSPATEISFSNSGHMANCTTSLPGIKAFLMQDQATGKRAKNGDREILINGTDTI